MTREEAIRVLEPFKDGMFDRYGCPISDAAIALDVAIEELKAQPKFTRITIDTDERWLNRKLDVFKDRLYLNEKTMIIYVPFVSFELIAQRGGTIKRIGEKQ